MLCRARPTDPARGIPAAVLSTLFLSSSVCPRLIFHDAPALWDLDPDPTADRSGWWLHCVHRCPGSSGRRDQRGVSCRAPTERLIPALRLRRLFMHRDPLCLPPSEEAHHIFGQDLGTIAHHSCRCEPGPGRGPFDPGHDHLSVPFSASSPVHSHDQDVRSLREGGPRGEILS